MSEHVTVVCLLPARNASDDLPDWFASAARFADAVVALDDGSTDETAALLNAHPLVQVVLRNPRRDDYRTWDDSANRNRLLEVAAALDPTWIMQLDADERMPEDDGAALRRFVDHEADPSCAYFLRIFAMVDDIDHCWGPGQSRARLFAYAPGVRFPAERLHFQAIPESIPPERWRHTTFRIQHLGGLTEERRRRRLAKYGEADPDRVYQRSYVHLVHAPVAIERWKPRSRHLPSLMNEPKVELAAPPSGPTLSVVVIAQNDQDVIAARVQAIVDQRTDEPFEVIVVTSGDDATADVVREACPGVPVIELDHPALPGEARNVGLRAATGQYVIFPGSHQHVEPGLLDATIQGHRLGYTMVTGPMWNGTPTRSGWASYFLENSTLLPGRPAGRLDVPPVRCSYLRDVLVELGGFPEDARAAEDTAVNQALFRRGYSAYRAGDGGSRHFSPCVSPGRLLRHHFTRGRGYGRLFLEDRFAAGFWVDGVMLHFLVLGLPQRVVRVGRNVHNWGHGLRLQFWLASPMLALAALSSWLGTCWEIAVTAVRARRPPPRPRRRPSLATRGARRLASARGRGPA